MTARICFVSDFSFIRTDFLRCEPKSRLFMRLSREEFWVLDTTVPWNSHLPLPYLNRTDADLFFNKRRHHGLSEDDLIDLIVLMQSRGDLTVFQKSEDMFPGKMGWVNHSFRTPGIRFICDFTPIWSDSHFYPKSSVTADFRIYEETMRADPRARYTGAV